jgi:N-acetylmuramoyl-L-alanine amidase
MAATSRAAGLIRAIAHALVLAIWAGSALAQDLAGLARLDAAASRVEDRDGGLAVTLYLSQPVPWRAYVLDAPRRLVLDFREVDFRGADSASMLTGGAATGLRMGPVGPGWSRLVADLAAPLVIGTAGMTVDDLSGTALVEVRLVPVDPDEFAARAGVPPGAGWEASAPPSPPVPPRDDVLTVVIDPGHGGIDPGAIRDDLTEAGLMLVLGLELAEAVNRAGMRAVLTREADVFVPLAQRMTIARAAGADLLVSLHADALEMDAARGASVYTLSQAALDDASARMAERHERGDLLAGLDLSGQDDTIATTLMDLARLETAPASARLADALVAGLTEAGARVNSRPRREGPLAVLNAADFPSVLVEVGFLSDAGDRERLTTPEGRAMIVAGLVAGLSAWTAGEEALAPLIRQ